MNPIAEEILGYYGSKDDSDVILHYGMKYRSGRYPYGSGEDPYQHGRDFLGRIEELKKQGWTETAENIKKEFGENVTLSDYRNEKKWCEYERRLRDAETAKRLRDKEGLGPTEIGRRMGINESTVRLLLNPDSAVKMKIAKNTADILKKKVDESEYGMLDVGKGTELSLRVSKEMLNAALYGLEGDGYVVYTGGIPQPTNTNQQTIQKVLCKPGTPNSAIYDYDKIGTIDNYISRDGGKTFEKKFTYPESLDSKRLKINYAEDGGIEKDGIIELRRNVPDLSLGESRYSQVRIMVDGTHYIKGMAVYSDNMPDGVDVVFNTNKPKGTPALGPKENTVLKTIKKDPDNPFGSLIKDADQGGQYWYEDKNTGEKKLGLINKRADEGDWSDWKDALPAQFLSKQSLSLAKRQLNIAKESKQLEYDELCSIPNPVIKKHLLSKFADECDAAAMDLKAAALPGQKYHVITAFSSIKDNEVYAPNYDNGTKLALIRFPHGGTFEIPIVTVNNKLALPKKILGADAGDAIGINSKVAERLSGADFDGDTVMCIPTNDPKGRVKIASRDPLKGLEGFDPKLEYGADPDKIKVDADGTVHRYRKGVEYPLMKKTDTEMGKISNLITDMTLDGGATDDEMARAVRHSMVVIDAEKHHLDYKASEVENGIKALKQKYQGKSNAGASTIISKSKGEVDVDKREGSPYINIKGNKGYDPSRPEGALIWKTARPEKLYKPDYTTDKKTGMRTIKTTDGKRIKYDPSNEEDRNKYSPVKRMDPDTGDVFYTNKDGTIKYARKTITQKSTRMAEVDDAYDLLSTARHPMEIVYADYANSMKAMANRARKEMVNTPSLEKNKNAEKVYKADVDKLKADLNNAELNALRERAALRKANVSIANKQELALQETGKKMKAGDVRKVGQQAVTKYREEFGSLSRKERNIEITDRQWEAIQSGAVTKSLLERVLNNTDIDKLRERATPRVVKTLTPAQVNRAKAMQANGFTIAEIAIKLGKSSSTISDYLKKE